MASDFISRQAALDAVCSDDCEDCPDGGCDIYRRLKRLPAADVRPVVHAHWEIFTDAGGRNDIRCSECKETPHWTVTTVEAAPLFCPNCGADMREDGGRCPPLRKDDAGCGEHCSTLREADR